MKGYNKNDSPISYGLYQDVEENRDVYVLKLDSSGHYKHIEAFSPEREIIKDGKMLCFQAKSSYKSVLEEASSYLEKDCILLTDSVFLGGEDGSFYDGFMVIWDGKWLLRPYFVNFEIDKSLYSDYGYSKKEIELIAKERKEEFELYKRRWQIISILIAVFFFIMYKAATPR
jgi:IS4 transposase